VRAASRRSCHFNEYFNCLPSDVTQRKRHGRNSVYCHKRNSCNMHSGKFRASRIRAIAVRRIQSCGTEVCQSSLHRSSTRARNEARVGASLDQRRSHVYSPIIRTGHSPPSQSSTLNLVVAGRGFCCLRCKESGNLVERHCVNCGWSWSIFPSSHYLLCSTPNLFFRRTLVFRGGCFL
jgi:hypothetical protein